MNSGDKLIAIVVLVFGAVVAIGAVADSLKQKQRSTTLDVEAGINCELKLGDGDEPNIIKCRLEDGRHKISEVGRE